MATTTSSTALETASSVSTSAPISTPSSLSFSTTPSSETAATTSTTMASAPTASSSSAPTGGTASAPTSTAAPATSDSTASSVSSSSSAATSSSSAPVTSSDPPQPTSSPSSRVGSSSSADPPTSMSASSSTSSSSSVSSSSASSSASSESSSISSSSSSSLTSSPTPPPSSLSSSPTPPPTSETTSTTSSRTLDTSSSSTSSSSSVTIETTDSSTFAPTPTPTPTPTQTREAVSSTSRPSVSAQTTLSSPVFFTTTNSNGAETTTAPPNFTSTFTSTNSDGSVSIVTQTVQNANPSLSPDKGSGHSTSQFFSNKGAVAGVFVIVGLAVASVCMWMLFAVRRKRVKRRLESEAAAVGPGGHRSPLHDDEEDEERTAGMLQRPSSSLSYGATGVVRPPSAYNNMGIGEQPQGGPPGVTPFDPYVGYPVAGAAAAEGSRSNPFSLNRAVQQGYAPARTSSPPAPGSPHSGSFGHEPNTSGSGELHTRSHSYSSYDPLLTAAGLAASDSSAGDNQEPAKPPPTRPVLEFLNVSPSAGEGGNPPTPPPRSPLRAQHAESPGRSRTSLGTGDASDEGQRDSRLDPNLAERLKRGNTTVSIRDDQDYSRPVLGVRNPDKESASVSEYSVHDDF